MQLEHFAAHSPCLPVSPFHTFSVAHRAHPLRRRSERFLNGGLKNRSRLNRCGVVALSAGYDALDIVVPVVRSVSTALYSLTFLLGVAFIGKQLLATEHVCTSSLSIPLRRPSPQCLTV